MTIYNQTAVEADGSISWRNGLTFCGVHDIGKKTLYLSESLTTILTDGQAPFASKTIPSVVDEICGRINQCVEETIANDRNNLSVQEVTSWQAARELKEYLEDGAHREAIDWFFRGSEPDGQFHSGYTLGNLPEAALWPGSRIRRASFKQRRISILKSTKRNSSCNF